MRLFHLLAEHWGDGSRTGVPRFSRDFQRAFPDVLNITPGLVEAVEWKEGDLVVTDNHLGMLVPERVPAVVVHHGCAPYHYSVDPGWRNPDTLFMAAQQRRVLGRPNTFFVAPSAWVGDRFDNLNEQWRIGRGHFTYTIPHWTRPWEEKTVGTVKLRPLVVGDWRNWNKGAEHIDAVRQACREVEFRQLDFEPTPEGREKAYRHADAYLCLSLSEGAPYSVADAEAQGLAIITTEVGNVEEFGGCYVVPNREDARNVALAVRFALLKNPRRRRNTFYSTFTWECWVARWSHVLRLASGARE